MDRSRFSVGCSATDVRLSNSVPTTQPVFLTTNGSIVPNHNVINVPLNSDLCKDKHICRVFFFFYKYIQDK